jgi:hypothetical protein
MCLPGCRLVGYITARWPHAFASTRTLLRSRTLLASLFSRYVHLRSPCGLGLQTYRSTSMRAVFATLLLAASASAFPAFQADFNENLARNLEFVKRDPELLRVIQDTYARQLKEKRNLDTRNVLADVQRRADTFEFEARTGSSASNSSCLSHPLPDFYPATVAGLKRFPEAAYPYQDPKPSDQRGGCPGLNTLANHGYIPRTVRLDTILIETHAYSNVR